MKTSILTGRALNWAVILANGQIPCMDHVTFVNRKDNHIVWWLDREYHQRWDHAGPIIEREKIELYWHRALECWAGNCDDNLRYGPTPLIAAMRCFIASRWGDEVAVPKDLDEI